LFGTASIGGNAGYGTVFAVNTDGSGFTTLYNFTALSTTIFHQTNSDGANPMAALVLTGDTLYGTAMNGGTSGSGFGALFAIKTNGTGFTNLHSFTYTDGADPQAGLILWSNTLYGTASGGGNPAGVPPSPGRPGDNIFPAVGGNGMVFSLSVAPIIPPTLTLEFWAGYPLLSLYGTLGDTYTVQYTTSLAAPNWTPMLIVPKLPMSPFQLIDPAGAGQPERFYRAVQSQ
jgi:uncharacterized repeat protein (TIGR03803 family)